MDLLADWSARLLAHEAVSHLDAGLTRSRRNRFYTDGTTVRDAAAADRWPTSWSTCTGSAGARDAGEGRTVFSKPGGGARVGEQLAALRA
jgi:hypothetical protein